MTDTNPRPCDTYRARIDDDYRARLSAVMGTPRMLTMAEAADRMGITKWALRMRIQRGTAAVPYQRQGQMYMFAETDVDAWVRLHGEGAGYVTRSNQAA